MPSRLTDVVMAGHLNEIVWFQQIAGAILRRIASDPNAG